MKTHGAETPAHETGVYPGNELKWILVACFGYQGFNNAKFGRSECHEAINAYAREILIAAKQRLEAGGWRVVHGIVDSIWVTPDPDVDDEKNSRERVALAHEKIESYDSSYYETQLVRAVESILAPLNWDRNDIRRELNGTHIAGITDWT